MPTGPEAFLKPPGVSRLQTCGQTHLRRPCAILFRLVGRTTVIDCYVDDGWSSDQGIKRKTYIASNIGPRFFSLLFKFEVRGNTWKWITDKICGWDFSILVVNSSSHNFEWFDYSRFTLHLSRSGPQKKKQKTCELKKAACFIGIQ